MSAKKARQGEPSQARVLMAGEGQKAQQQRLLELTAAISAAGTEKGMLILPHNDPDPDSIASAYALCMLLTLRVGVEARIAYHGIVGRAENRALVRYLGYPLRRLTWADPTGSADALRDATRKRLPVALVDAQPGAGNVTIPPAAKVVAVIDHHPRRAATQKVPYADVRTEIGATSTMLTEYLRASGVEPSRPVATALFYGIKTDTLGLSRQASPEDVDAYLYLQPRIDVHALARIENAEVPASYFRSFDAALKATRVYSSPSARDSIVMAYLGPMDYPGLAPEMADFLLRLKRSQWVICMGTYRDRLLLSVRTRSPHRRAEQLVVAVVGEEGTAGGHGPMAAGQVPLAKRSPAQLADRIRRRILSELQADPGLEGIPLI